jgi:hypothetical protein
MTEQDSQVAVPAQGGPPLADTSDMACVHRVFRDAVSAAPSLIGAAAGNPERVATVGSYYSNVLHFLHGHHEGEDLSVWPRLCERAPEQADEVRRVAGQHDEVVGLLADAQTAIAAWQLAPDEASASAAATAVVSLGSMLVQHLDEEEEFIVPLAAQYILAPEWGELPSHGMRTFEGDKLWLILGLIREQMTAAHLASMDANMPPPVAAMWRDQGEAAFNAFMADLRS